MTFTHRTGELDALALADGPARHGELQRLSDDIAMIVHGRDAAAAAARDDGRLVDGVYVLPVWAWALSDVDLGRKDRSARGRLLMPARLVWDVPTVGLIRDLEGREPAYEVAGLGISAEGTVRIEASGSILPSAAQMLGATLGDGVRAWTADMSTRSRQGLWAGFAQAQETAYWSLLSYIEESARFYLPRAVIYLSRSVAPTASSRVVDEEDQEQILGEFMLGAQNSEGRSSSAMQLLERCLAPRQFAKADPQRVITRAIKRDVTETLRRRIKDSRQGAAIREVAREVGALDPQSTEDVDRVCEEYRRRYPQRTAGAQMVRSALMVEANPVTASLDETDGPREMRGVQMWRG